MRQKREANTRTYTHTQRERERRAHIDFGTFREDGERWAPGGGLFVNFSLFGNGGCAKYKAEPGAVLFDERNEAAAGSER